MTVNMHSERVVVVANTFWPAPLIGKHKYPALLDISTGWWCLSGPCRGVTGQFHYN
jgi:hypothetical protein